MIQHEIKNRIVEIAPIYITKALGAMTLLGLSSTDFIDWFIRVVAAVLAAILTLYTIKRMSADIAYRKQETRTKEIENAMREEELKNTILENMRRQKEFNDLLKTIKNEEE
jgi:hypothetical protein